MCIFSGAVQHVNATRIFCRMDDAGIQYLVYQMEFSSDNDVAMILPFPLDRNGDEPEFLSLEETPNFFKKLDKAFPQPVTRSARRRTRSADFNAKSIPLKVHNVGAFEASFVPNFEDFDRLDERFRLPEGVIAQMKELYSDYAFAVFKLKRGTKQKVHPMAFKFPTANRDSIFFPTKHVHDGASMPSHERYDHALYVQVPDYALERDLGHYKAKPDPRVELSSIPIEKVLHLKKNLHNIIVNKPTFKITLRERMPNIDVPWNLTDEAAERARAQYA